MGRMKNIMKYFRAKPFVAVVRLEGAIGMGQRGLSDVSVSAMVDRAFSKGKPKAVALVINSPGGSPVQSALIAARIKRLSKEKDIPVFAFVEDVAASGGYWLACSAGEIFVDPGSVVGSIGVISAGFGLDQAIAKHGVERRVHTAGESKSFMDPFRPETPEDVARLDGILNDMHDVFMAEVKTQRGDRLSTDVPLFTGDFWLGQKAVELGLADHIGHLIPVMQAKYGEKVKFRYYRQKRSVLSRIGMNVVEDALALVQERAAFARFGL